MKQKNNLTNDATPTLDLDEKKYIIIGSVVIILIFLFIVVWGFLVKIDTYVIAPGKVVISTFKKPVQYYEWAKVSKIFVKDGEFVKKGDLLIEIEKFKEKASYDVLERKYYFLLAQRDRLLSEKKGFSKVKFSKEFLNCPDKSILKKFAGIQREVFYHRRKNLTENLAVLKFKERELKDHIKGIKEVLSVKRGLVKSYEKEISVQDKLLSLRLVNKYRIFDLRNAKDTLISDIENLKSQFSQFNSQVEEVKKQQAVEIQKYKNEVNQKFEDVLSDLSSVVPQLEYAKQEMKKTIFRAPVSGQIIGLKVHTVGEVIKPGETFLFIVPGKEKVFILSKVLPKDIDKVKVGQSVDLRFPSFVNIATKVVEGKVVYISNDTVPQEAPVSQRGRTYEAYEAHICLTEKGKEQLKKYNLTIIPGMPAIAYIKAQKLTPVEYMLNPAITLLKAAFRSN